VRGSELKKLLLLALVAVALPAGAVEAEELSGGVDLLEIHTGSGDDQFVFDGELRAGGERHAGLVKLSGGGDVGPHIDEVSAQVLYEINPREGVSLMAGVRHDFREGKDLTFGAFGATAELGEILSLEHFFFVSERGDLTGEAMVLGTVPLGPALTLEPRGEISWSAQHIVEEELGSGVTDVTLSVRLRRGIGPLVNVYLGVIHERLLSDTKSIALANGDRGHATRAVIGAGLAF